MASEADLLLERLCREAPALAQHPRVPLDLVAQKVRLGLLSLPEALAAPGSSYDTWKNRVAFSPVLTAEQASQALATAPADEPYYLHSLLERLMELGEPGRIAAWLSTLPLQEQAGCLETLLPRWTPTAVLGPAWPGLRQAMVEAVHRGGKDDQSGLLWSVLLLLEGEERTALVQWAVDIGWLEGMSDEGASRLPVAGAGAREVARAQAIDGPYSRAIKLSHLADWMPLDHPDRLALTRAQLDLMRLPRSSQPYQTWRLQLLAAPVPEALHAEVLDLLATWPASERAVALLKWAEHTPALREQALATLASLWPQGRVLGQLLHFHLLAPGEQARAWAAGRELALAQERMETPEYLRAVMLWQETRPNGFGDLWTLLARHAPTREQGLEAVEHAERCLAFDVHRTDIRLAREALRALPAGPARDELARVVIAEALALPGVAARLELAGGLGDLMVAPEHERLVALYHACIDARAPSDWQMHVTCLLEDLPAPAQAAVLEHTLKALRQRTDERWPWALLDLAGFLEGPQRWLAIEEGLTAVLQGPPVYNYPVFRTLRPDDPAPVHALMLRLLEHLDPKMDVADVRSEVAARLPESLRQPTIEAALAAWERQGLTKFDIATVPAEPLLPVLNVEQARRLLAICRAHPRDDGTDELLAQLLPRLAELGELAGPLAEDLRLIDEHLYLRLDGLTGLAPHLTGAQLFVQLLRLIPDWLRSDNTCGLLDVLPLVARLSTDDREVILRKLDQAVRVSEDVLLGSSFADVCRALFPLGERRRAERWLAETGYEGDWVVGAWVDLAAALPAADPRRPEVIAKAQELCDRLSELDHDYIYQDLMRAQDALDPAWLARQVDRVLSSKGMCIRELIPWMPLTVRALGPERMGRFILQLCRGRRAS